MQALEKNGSLPRDIQSTDGSTESAELQLFRRNFIVMNALYQIQRDFRDTAYKLSISSLKIFIYAPESSEDGALIESGREDIEADRALSEYYLNWENYRSTDQQTVDELLNGFWQRYTEYNQRQKAIDKRLDALQKFGLKSNASWKDIQRAYRRKVAMTHPDKGGTSHLFMEIRAAYLILKLTHNK